MTITEHTDKVCLLAGITLSLAGLREFISKVTPVLEFLAVIIQVIVGIYTLYHLFHKRKTK
jgi:Na+/H+ antiporter NhaB